MILSDIENYGIIGAGGAGFPTHVKLNSSPDTIIMNAAECEPLLHKDMQILLNYPSEVLEGFYKVLELTGAREGIIGIKEKHAEEIELLRSMIRKDIRIIPIEDIYPAGDEITLIYLTTKRLVQPGKLPASIGCVINNVETFYNIGMNSPVVDKFISVAGAVENPATIKVPVGTSYSEVLSYFKITEDKYVIRSGGLMMGKIENNLNKPVSKRTGALIVLPEDHHCSDIYSRYTNDHDIDRIAKAGCDQCNFCTEFCPRYLLGYPVRPETAMRNRMFTMEEFPMLHPGNFYCCECNLCTMYACPESLDPKGAALIEKRFAKEQNIKWNNAEVSVHPMFEYRKVPTRRLMQRLDLMKFNDEGPLIDHHINPDKVSIPLNEHIGVPAVPVVPAGQKVKRCDLIAQSAGKISCNIHSSINGTVMEITTDEIKIRRN